MEIIHDLSQVSSALNGPVMAVGNFDGVHLGHREVFQNAANLAKELKRPWAVLTFDPHPAKVLAPELAPSLITTMNQRLKLIAESDPAACVVLGFDRDLAEISAQSFVKDLLVERLGVSGVVVGYDFTFGKNRAGTVSTLEDLGSTLGFCTRIVPPFSQEGIVISSSKVRAFILAGRVYAAGYLLGHYVTLEGPVVSGEHRGAALGFPTANVDVEQELLPAPGVYAAWCSFGEQTYEAAVNIGSVPTFRTGGQVTVEAHLLDWEGDLYGKRLRVELVRRLRPEKRYDTAAQLVDQIKLDVMQIRQTLLKLQPEHLVVS